MDSQKATKHKVYNPFYNKQTMKIEDLNFSEKYIQGIW